MDQTVENGISQCGIANRFMPVFKRELTRHNRGTTIVTVLKEFKQLSAIFIIERCQSPIV